MDLNAIEMAAIAELDLEMARAYDEVSMDPSQTPETRRKAGDLAARWRERARLCRLEAQRLSSQPLLPANAAHAYTGPERRKQERRRGDRRTTGLNGPGHAAVTAFGRDRRINPDRRRGDRRHSAGRR